MSKGKWMLIASAMFIVCLSACSETGTLNTGLNGSSSSSATGFTPAVAKGSLLVLDQANQALKAINLATGTITNLLTFPDKEPNDIQIDGNYAYVADSECGKLFRVDLSNGGSTSLSLPPYSNPDDIAIGSNQIFVTLAVSNMVSVISKSSYTLLTNINLDSDSYPEGIVVGNGNIYVASCGYLAWGNPGNYTNSRITILSESDYSVVSNVPCSQDPESLQAYGTYIIIAATGNYSNINGMIQSMNASAPYALTNLITNAEGWTYVKTDGRLVYASDDNDNVIVANYNTLAVVTNIALQNVQGINISSNGVYFSTGYLGTVCYLMNTNNFSVKVISNIGGGASALY